MRGCVKLTIVGLVLISLVSANFLTFANSQTTYQEAIISEADVVFSGEVVNKESYEVKTDDLNTIMMRVTILDDSVKGKSKYREFIIPGGKINDTEIIYDLNPYGTLDCEVGQYVKVYQVINQKSKKAITVKIDVIRDLPIGILSFSSDDYIYEEYGCNFEFTGDYWDDSDMPIDYSVNITNDEGPGLTGEAGEIIASFNTWENAPYSDIDFHYDGLTDVRTVNTADGVNAVFWRESSYFTDTLGVSANTLGLNVKRIVSHEIKEFDIVLNDGFDWCKGAVSGEYDIRNVVTHEVGHNGRLLDLYDSSNTYQTMYGYIDDDDTSKRSLYTGDNDGIKYIYPDDDRPTVTILAPDDSSNVDNGDIDITASVTCDDPITSVQFKITSSTGFSYDSDWQTMTYSGGNYIGSWSTIQTGYHYIIVRGQSDQYIPDYDVITVNLIGD